MEPLEEKLKRALEQKEPPAGFAGRVLAHVRAQASAAPGRQTTLRPVQAWLLRPAWRAVLAGALAALMVLGAGLAYYRRQERLRGEQARKQLLLALQIASSQLKQVRQVFVEDTDNAQEAPLTNERKSE